MGLAQLKMGGHLEAYGMSGTAQPPAQLPTAVKGWQVATERHFEPAELGALWHLSADTVRRLFENEPGVLVIDRGGKHRSRRYRTLRIPESVAQRVHRRMTNP